MTESFFRRGRGASVVLAAVLPALMLALLGGRGPAVGAEAAGSEADTTQGPVRYEGVASYYGSGLAGRPTASGEPFDPSQMTAAHRTLPFGARVRVTNLRNGRSVVVRINDRGPFASRRIIDLSRAAAARLGMLRRGTVRVRLEVLPPASGKTRVGF